MQKVLNGVFCRFVAFNPQLKNQEEFSLFRKFRLKQFKQVRFKGQKVGPLNSFSIFNEKRLEKKTANRMNSNEQHIHFTCIRFL